MMVLVYGSRIFTRKYQNVLIATCGVCGKRTTFHVTRDQVWVTFFLIPIFPATSECNLFCDGCLKGRKLYDGNGGRLLRLRRHTKQLLENALTQEEYETKVEKLKLALDEIVPRKKTDYWKCPVCKTMNHKSITACGYCGYWN